MNLKHYLSITLGLLFIFQSVESIAQEKVLLRLNLEEGKTYSITTTTNQDISQTIMGMDQSIKQGMGFTYDLRVLERNWNGDHKVDMTFSKVKYSNESSMGSSNYDSEDPSSEPDQQSRAYAAMLDQTLGMTMNSRGKVQEVTGVEGFIDHMADFFGLNEGAETDEFKQALSEEFGPDQLSEQFGGISIEFPEEEIGVGSSWVDVQSTTTSFPLTISTTYTVTSINNSKVFLDVESDVNAESSDEEVQEVNGMEMKYDIAGKQNGTMTIDLNTGLTIESSITQDFSGTVEMLPNVQLPDGMTWPITLESEISVKLN